MVKQEVLQENQGHRVEEAAVSERSLNLIIDNTNAAHS